jgi:hypothetical protein
MKGHHPGEKPRLAWVPITQLDIDARYQRGIDGKRSQRLIAGIGADFRWDKYGTLLVCPHGIANDRYLVLDGQHRKEGAGRAGIETVPCSIIHAPRLEDQAAAFLGANRDRVAVTPYALHHAMVLAGEAAATELTALLTRAGLQIPRHPIPPKSMKPGQTIALAAIQYLLSQYGSAHAEFTLATLADAFHDQRGRLRGALIKAVALILVPPHQDRRSALIHALRRHTEIDFAHLVLDFRAGREGTTEADAIQSILLDLIAGREPIVAARRAGFRT